MQKKIIPKSIYAQVLVLVVLLVCGALVVMTEPDISYSSRTIRNFNVVGLWCQLFGVIILSFEFLRGPLALEQKDDYVKQCAKRKEDFKKIISLKDNKEKVRRIDLHMKQGFQLEHVYFSVINFNVTVKVMYWLGLFFVCLGYVFQLAVT
jgi:hypothetical protein